MKRVFLLAALVSTGFSAWLGLQANTAEISAAIPLPVESVACTSVQGSCGGYAGWHDETHGNAAFTRIAGTLTIPRVECAKSQYLSAGQYKGADSLYSWLGLGGDPGNTVGQAGILLICVKGKSYPQIWEWTTAMDVNGAPIRWHLIPGVMTGDQVYVSVRTHGESYLFTMRIPAIGWKLSGSMPCPLAACENNSAEAVLEAVTHDNVPVFSGAHFAGIHVWAGPDRGALAPNPRWYLASNTVARPGGGVLISRGKLSDGGSTFTPELENKR